MKKKLLILFAGIFLLGCGTTDVGTEYEDETLTKEVQTDVIEDVVTEDITEQEDISKLELLNQFMAGEIDAISDVTYEVWGYESEVLINLIENDTYSIEDIKAIPDKVTSWDNFAVYYSYFREDSDNPFLMILIPTNPNFIDENNCLLVFTAYEDGVHLTDFMTSMEEAYTSVYVGKDGLISYQEHPLGMSSSDLISAGTYIVNDDGKIINLFCESITSLSGYEYIEDDTGIGQILTAVYANSESWPYVGELITDEDTYYILYSDGLDEAADLDFKNRCAESGITIQSREELIPLCESYVRDLGYEIDILSMDANTAEWNRL